MSLKRTTANTTRVSQSTNGTVGVSSSVSGRDDLHMHLRHDYILSFAEGKLNEPALAALADDLEL